ncbi:MAG TPA: hypothetical protein VK324_04650 [Tepidisphaeraceae bacterium]|nr:hypothetical protein [Tepidisphaeraceae bacterium]
MATTIDDYEKLGVFYLGRPYDLANRRPLPGAVLYESKDLVTHAVCVGMTGSGKTGLCIGLLEEAAIDGVPAIVIDPKGDLANLLLTFPDLRPGDFLPWVNVDDARKKGWTPEQYATQQAETWRNGLEAWGQSGDRIRKLKESADFAIYTPGSTAGIPMSIVQSFAAPPAALLGDNELLQDRVRTTATGLLALLGVDADPIQSREHILLSTIFNAAWRAGQDLDLPALIGQIQQPPVQRVGVLDVEQFFPSKERSALAMRLNNLLAAPGFEAWLSGEPLDVPSLLHTPAGKPRVAIVSIAHLSDAERMFVVSMLLNQIVGWMRTQSGTTSLRAVVYMDEIFGYFPPVANPPSKQPLLTLLKQARAYGVGVVLATQNPVDLDYKGLANCGTWLIGRLQTDRDKQRVLDGLEGAAASASSTFDRGRMEQTLAGLGTRVFLMNNVHDDAPVVFETRWALSYLRGPLTRQQIKQLTDPRRAALTTAAPASSGPSPKPSADAASVRNETADRRTSAAPTGPRPVLPPGVSEVFLPVRSTRPPGAALRYEPAVYGCGRVHVVDAKTDVEVTQDAGLLVPLEDAVADVDWTRADDAPCATADLEPAPAAGATFAPVPPTATRVKTFDAWQKQLADALYRTTKVELRRSPTFKVASRPGESERDFRVRLSQSAREQRDALVERLKQKYAPKLAAVQERIRRAEQVVQREKEQATATKWQTAVSFGATVLGGLFGRKTASAGNVGRATTAARGVGRSVKESQDVDRAAETVEAVKQQMIDLDAQFQSELATLEAKIDPMTEPLEPVVLRPRKSDVSVRTVALAWSPHWIDTAGRATRAW